jgi:hypothetical protein
MFALNDYVGMKLAKAHHDDLMRDTAHDRLVKTAVNPQKIEKSVDEKKRGFNVTKR